MYSEKDIKVYSTVGQLNSEDLYYVNEMYPKKACECYVKETKKALGPERIKKVNESNDRMEEFLSNQREELEKNIHLYQKDRIGQILFFGWFVIIQSFLIHKLVN